MTYRACPHLHLPLALALHARVGIGRSTGKPGLSRCLVPVRGRGPNTMVSGTFGKSVRARIHPYLEVGPRRQRRGAWLRAATGEHVGRLQARQPTTPRRRFLPQRWGRRRWPQGRRSRKRDVPVYGAGVGFTTPPSRVRYTFTESITSTPDAITTAKASNRK